MIRPVVLALFGAAAIAMVGASTSNAQPVIPGSTAFCLYEVPVDETGKRRWINLGIAQYIDATRSEVRIYYGGGAFGAGHDARIPVNSMEEALGILEKLRRVAAACR